MNIPLYYSIRNLRSRRLTSFLTAFGMALVVFVFASVLMLAEGLIKTLVNTGSPHNVIVIRKASVTEVQSGIERQEAAVAMTQSEIATGADGRRLAAKELVVLINLMKRGTMKPGQVVTRGITEQSFLLRPQVRLVEGRKPRAGSSEIMAGAGIAKRFQGCGIGETLRFAMRDWTVVGLFEAGNTAFDSELWGDSEQLMQAFRRPYYSSVVFRLENPASFDAVRKRIEDDPRFALEAKRETRYYADQSEMMSKFILILGVSLTVTFSLGAVIGAMITMYSSVANRTSEIGTLRALGFKRRNILVAFVVEAILLGLVGGGIGLFFASFLQLLTISTINIQTLSELSFSFSLTSDIAIRSMFFSLIMGFVGGVLPAVRAARMNIVEALRAG